MKVRLDVEGSHRGLSLVYVSRPLYVSLKVGQTRPPSSSPPPATTTPSSPSTTTPKPAPTAPPDARRRTWRAFPHEWPSTRTRKEAP